MSDRECFVFLRGAACWVIACAIVGIALGCAPEQLEQHREDVRTIGIAAALVALAIMLLLRHEARAGKGGR